MRGLLFHLSTSLMSTTNHWGGPRCAPQVSQNFGGWTWHQVSAVDIIHHASKNTVIYFMEPVSFPSSDLLGRNIPKPLMLCYRTEYPTDAYRITRIYAAHSHALGCVFQNKRRLVQIRTTDTKNKPIKIRTVPLDIRSGSSGDSITSGIIHFKIRARWAIIRKFCTGRLP